MHKIAVINSKGAMRVLNGSEGMTFVVDHLTTTEVAGMVAYVAHVRDYRFPSDNAPFQIWSIGPEGYELLLCATGE